VTELDWALLGTLIIQTIFWSYQQHRLIDKVMSGNYYSYEQARGINAQLPAKVSEIDPGQFEDLRGVKGIHPFM
jgi:hypothetical protein